MIVSVSSGTSKLHVLFLFPWKLNTVFFFWLVARNWMCPSLKTCRRERGKRLQRKRAGGKKRGGGGCHTERMKERPTETDPQPVHSLMPWSFPRNAATSVWKCTHLSVNSVLNTRNIWRRSGEAARSHTCCFPFFLSLFFLRGWEKVPRPSDSKLKARESERVVWRRNKSRFEYKVSGNRLITQVITASFVLIGLIGCLIAICSVGNEASCWRNLCALAGKLGLKTI